jgi:Fe-S cluster assembly protein SufD
MDRQPRQRRRQARAGAGPLKAEKRRRAAGGKGAVTAGRAVAEAPAAGAPAETAPWLSAFAALERDGWLRRDRWTAALRRAALDRFAALGFPTTRQEEWRFTSVAPIARVPFRPQAAYHPNGLTPEQFERFTFEPWECSHLVFVNGYFAPELSTLRAMPEGVRVMSLAEAFRTRRDAVEPHLGRLAGVDRHAFTALNTAFMQDGLFMEIPAGVAVDEPIHLLFVSSPHGGELASCPRNLIVAGRGSQAAIVESYVNLDDGARYFTNAVTEIVAMEGAAVDHYKIEREGPAAFHVATVQAHLARDSRLASYNVSIGGALVRNDINVVLDGEGAECRLDGLYTLSGSQHVDNHTLIDHVRPHGTSHELYKGVLDGRSRGVFDGRIIVRADAQKTDAHQVNRNLVLSEEALVDTTPRLEILADDVKCTHGATVGQLDEDALFYLRSRAIGQEAAANMLMQAFVSDVVHRIKIAPIRAGLECLLFTRLPREHRREAHP